MAMFTHAVPILASVVQALKAWRAVLAGEGLQVRGVLKKKKMLKEKKVKNKMFLRVWVWG